MMAKMRLLGVVMLLGLCGWSAGLRGDSDVLALPHRKLSQGLGQPPVPQNVQIPPATCSRPGPNSFLLSLRDSDGQHSCSGVLIFDDNSKFGNLTRWGVTTAHCIDDNSKPNAIRLPKVHVTGRTLNEPIEMLDTERTFVHPEWASDPKLGYDIALLKLVNVSCHRFPMKIVDDNFTVPQNASIMTVSFGREREDAAFPDRLQQGIYKLIPRDECEQDYLQQGTTLEETMLCARGPNLVGLCLGSEGSPLFWTPQTRPPDPFSKRLLGLGSFLDADSCTSTEGTGIYTSMAAVRDWIITTMRENS